MLPSLIALVLVADGVPPKQMADIVAERLSRLDRLVLEVEVEVFLAPSSATFDDDRSTWDGPYPAGSGAHRRLRIVRPCSLEENWGNGDARGMSAFSPGRTVQRLWRPSYATTIYTVKEDVMTSATYSSVPLLTMFDVQIHESFVPGLNTLRLLSEYPTKLLRVEGDVNAYQTQLAVHAFGDWTETYEYDLDACGTLLRQRMRRENSAFWFEREFRVLSTLDVNGAALPAEFLSITRNSVADSVAIHRFVVTSACVDASLAPANVRIEPERRNSAIHVTRADLSEESERYDSNGVLIASSAWEARRDVWRRAILPTAATCALAAACGLAFMRRASRGRP